MSDNVRMWAVTTSLDAEWADQFGINHKTYIFESEAAAIDWQWDNLREAGTGHRFTALEMLSVADLHDRTPRCYRVSVKDYSYGEPRWNNNDFATKAQAIDFWRDQFLSEANADRFDRYECEYCDRQDAGILQREDILRLFRGFVRSESLAPREPDHEFIQRMADALGVSAAEPF